ncbi:MAG TPA: hypothetical protein VJR89_38715 [Polyangiales bacterium]|nr:hypothetical protein [Polyangiales bacterium]
MAKLFVLSILLLAGLSSCGGGGGDIPNASCQACGGITVTEAFCKQAGEANGCETSSFTAATGDQCAGCKFTNCNEPPSCDRSASPRDAGSKDPEIDPACKTADADGDGMFSSTPPCKNPGEVKINGATSYTCPCGACPCGYECGSIKLSSGGTLSSVCAPPSR